ncbi:MAG: metallophosphoesterase family protein [Bacteroidota bacterium]
MKIGLLSDTHGFLDEKLLNCFKDCDELWHAGDIGEVKVLDKLKSFKTTRAVYGNIDSLDVQVKTDLELNFEINKVRFWMTHIGAKPKNYNPGIRKKLDAIKPDIFICGHSHICKIQYDENRKLLYINPGACGNHGFHKIKTALRFDIGDGKLENMEVIELGKIGVKTNK